MSRRDFLKKTGLSAAILWISQVAFIEKARALIGARLMKQRKKGWFAWGTNSQGQFGNSQTQMTGQTTPKFSFWPDYYDKMEYCDGWGLTIKIDGTLWSWGQNIDGQLGLGDVTMRSSPTQIGSDTDWVNVFRGRNNSFAIKTNGTLWGWGNNNSGVFGLNSTTYSKLSSPVQIGSTSDWAKVSHGLYHILGVKTNGTLWAWGNNLFGQLGNGNTTTSSSPVQISALTNWNTVHAGYYASMARNTSNQVYTWGYSSYGILGHGDSINRSVPTQIGGHAFTKITFRVGHTLALKSDNTLWGWGANGAQQLRANDNQNVSSMIQVGTATNWSTGSGAHGETSAMRTDGTMWTWGYNMDYSGGVGSGVGVIYTPLQIGTATDWAQMYMINGGGGQAMMDFSVSKAMGFARKTNGTLWYWGGMGQMMVPNNYYSTPTQVGTATWSHFTAKSKILHGVQTNGTLWGLGESGVGTLAFGDGITSLTSTMVQIGSDTDWAKVFTNNGTAAAIKTNGTLWVWGENQSGALGTGNTTDVSTPIQLGTATNWSEVITAGSSYSCVMLARKTDSTLWVWGANLSGCLGTGLTSNVSSPVQIGGAEWSKIAAGYSHTLLVKTNGTLWATGGNNYGQLGDGTFISRSSPVQIGIGNTWSNAFCGPECSFAVRSDGTLWAWGSNFPSLSLGINLSWNLISPTQLSADTNWADIFVSGFQQGSTYDYYAASAAKKSDGTFWAWGEDPGGWGGLGVGSSGDKSSPVQIVGTDWSYLSIGFTSFGKKD